MTSWQALQGAETTIEGKKERRAQGDVNIRQMGMGSWHANLSKGAVPNAPLGSKSCSTGQATSIGRKK